MTVRRLWLDTNVTRSVDDLKELSKLAQVKQVKVIIHAQVYLERRRQKQVELKKAFKPKLFDKLLTQLRYEVPEMRVTRATAATWADTLYERYPDHVTWEFAKKATLGGELRKDFQVEPGRMPMTTDWLIALEIEHDRDSYVITEDGGEEWQVLRSERRVFGWSEAIEWLRSLPDPEPGAQVGQNSAA